MRQLTRRATQLRNIMIFVLLLSAFGRLVWVQVWYSDDVLARAAEMRQQSRDLYPNRGAIIDRNGRVLANSVWLRSVVANPQQVLDKPGTAAKLAPMLGMPSEQILGILNNPLAPGFTFVKRRIRLEQAEEVEKLALEGIQIMPEAVRQYPQGTVASQLVGFVRSSDGMGLEGLEYQYEEELKGKPGQIQAEFTHGDVPISGTVTRHLPSQEGKTLVLTIDAALQRTVEQHLEKVVAQTKAKRAMATAMDVKTGEILVMAMRPGYDLSVAPGDAPPDHRRNWAVTDALSPGSIFKPITVAGALEERAITLTEKFIDEGRYRLTTGEWITNWDGGVPHKDPVTVAELLQHSSNVGLVKIGHKLGKDRFKHYLDVFGLLRPTGVDFPGESEPVFNWDHQKREIDWANMFIGQHFLLTPIQMLRASGAIANGGKLVEPHLVREIRSADGRDVLIQQRSEPRQVISAESANEVRQLMIRAVEKGTGGAAITPGYRVGGKTGTAEKFDEKGKKKDRYTATFVGFAPADAPAVVVLVMVDEPEGNGYGGQVAAPVFRALLPDIMTSMGINPDPNDPRLKALDQAKPKEPLRAQKVPDLVWLPVSTALERAFRAGYTPRVKGDGNLVTGQSLAAGSQGKPGEVLLLTADRPLPSERGVRVPNLLGASLAEAADLLGGMNLAARPEGSGYVTAQDPAPGTLVPPRTAVRIQLSVPR